MLTNKIIGDKSSSVRLPEFKSCHHNAVTDIPSLNLLNLPRYIDRKKSSSVYSSNNNLIGTLFSPGAMRKCMSSFHINVCCWATNLSSIEILILILIRVRDNNEYSI